MGVNARPAAFVSHLSRNVVSRRKMFAVVASRRKMSAGRVPRIKAENTQASQTEGRLTDDRTEHGTNGENARYTS